MRNISRTKFVSDVDVKGTALNIRHPFRLSQENQRRFVRLEISSPMSLYMIKDIFGNFQTGEQEFTIDGKILNLSMGGVLIEVDQSLNEGDIVAMRFSLQEGETIDNVLGVIKRSDQDGDCCLAGIEFVDRDHLADKLSQGEMDILSDRLTDFKDSIRQVLERYVYQERVVNDAR